MTSFEFNAPKDKPVGDLFCILAEAYGISAVFRGHGWNHGFEVFAAFGAAFECMAQKAQEINNFQQSHQSKPVICHFNYDVKNDLEKLYSTNTDVVQFPHCFAFVPEWTVGLKNNIIHVNIWSEKLEKRDIEHQLSCLFESDLEKATQYQLTFHSGINHSTYLSDLDQLKAHIQRGDIYQANYCHAFFWEGFKYSGAELFNKGHATFPNPFAVYYKILDHQLISFSPERFLAIEGRRIYSQPMKGTAPRGESLDLDQANLEMLRNSEKERRENVMIVDMVRNDLSHYAMKGSVRVPELYHIETFPRMHQMISTVEAFLEPGVAPLEALLKAFPMGSMTGAPKVRAMEILENLEHYKRGVYSGTVGFITHEGTADFNVVIRSFILEKASQKLAAFVGGGITALSNPHAEWDECQVKIKPLIDLLRSYSENQTDPLPLKHA